MLAIFLLIAVGVLLGLFFHWGVLAIASLGVVVARGFFHFYSGQSLVVDLLMLGASLCALQGGYILGGFVGYRKDN